MDGCIILPVIKFKDMKSMEVLYYLPRKVMADDYIHIVMAKELDIYKPSFYQENFDTEYTVK